MPGLSMLWVGEGRGCSMEWHGAGWWRNMGTWGLLLPSLASLKSFKAYIKAYFHVKHFYIKAISNILFEVK